MAPRTCRQVLVFVSFFGVFLAIGFFIVFLSAFGSSLGPLAVAV